MIKQVRDYTKLLGEHIVVDDWQSITLLLAAAAAHKIEGEMLWLRLIGAPGTGKTELLNSLGSVEGYCERIESLTPAAIRRGYVPDNKERLPTLLERINGKLVITKELAPLLTSARELKLEVFGLLRSVHDGELVADYGSRQGYITQKARFDWILGSTRYIDRQAALEAQLGSRFIDLRWGAPIDRRLAVTQAVNNDGGLPLIRQSLAEAMTLLIDSIKPQSLKPVHFDSFLPDIANFVARYRTPVERDRQNKEYIVDMPDIELGTRVGQAFARIAKGLALIGITDYKPYLRRLALDCLPPLRAKYVKGLLAGRKTVRDLGDYMSISQVTAHYTKEDFKYLGFTLDQLDLVSDNGYLPSKT